MYDKLPFFPMYVNLLRCLEHEIEEVEQEARDDAALRKRRRHAVHRRHTTCSAFMSKKQTITFNFKKLN